MNKKFNITSKAKYTAPTIEIINLNKIDVLMSSAGENRSVQAMEFDGFDDLLSSMFT